MTQNKKESHLGFRLSYDGAAFHGFQYQKNALSLQEKIEDAFRVYFKTEQRINFTSRTDAGVHARDQWVILQNAFPVFQSLSQAKQDRSIASLNFLFGPSIRVWQILEIKPTFHFKKHVLWKRYEYHIFNSPVQDPLLEKSHLWIRDPLNFQRMKAEMKHLLGEQDFAAFAKRSGRKIGQTKAGDTIRNVLAVRLTRSKHSIIPHAHLYKFEIQADGFLHHMVRNIIGSLIEVGMGKSLEIKSAMISRNRRLAGRNASSFPLILAETRLARSQFKPLYPI